MSNMSYQPIIIIGAGRSGTNILRDTLTQIPGYATWPCDEINYIWRHGNIRYPTDELKPVHATPKVRAFIHKAFDKLSHRYQVENVVEKTCANSLRVSFVDAVLPEAKYLFIVRDGRDVVASAMKRWTASLEIRYILQKARYVPVSDIPYYGLRYLGNRIYRLTSGQKRLASWGPRFDGMQEMLQTRSLASVCAEQWRRCIESSEADFAEIDPNRIHRLRYEDFVQHPVEELVRLSVFLGQNLTTEDANRITRGISGSSIGKWRSDLKPYEVDEVMSIGSSLLERYGYV